jgi:hypothetical protein
MKNLTIRKATFTYVAIVCELINEMIGLLTLKDNIDFNIALKNLS